MEIETAKFVPFAYTIKSLGQDLDADYDPFFRKLSKHKIEYKIAEVDGKGKKHYHGIVLLPKNFYRRRLTTQGFSLKLVQLYDRAGWIRYIHKDVAYNDFEQMAEDIDELVEDVLTPKSQRCRMPKCKLF